MKTRLLDDAVYNKLDDNFIELVNSIDQQNIGIVDRSFYIRKVKIEVLDENKQLLSFLNRLKLGEYQTQNGYRTYENLKVAKKITKKKKETKSVEYIHNELPSSSLNVVVNKDCLKYMRSLPNNCIDCIITSPPYNFGIDYGDYYSDKGTWNDYFKRMEGIIAAMYRVLTTGGRVIFNIQPFYSDYIPSHHIFSNLFLKHNFIWRNEIIWEKNNYSARYTSWGSWKSPASPYLKYTHEYIEVYCKETIKHLNKRNVQPDITDEEFKKSVIGKWSIAPERNMKQYNHDAMFPEKLVERALRLYTYPKDTVLDPFGGVGTTAVVCRKLNRNYISVDISKDYCDTAVKRIDSVHPTIFDNI